MTEDSFVNCDTRGRECALPECTIPNVCGHPLDRRAMAMDELESGIVILNHMLGHPSIPDAKRVLTLLEGVLEYAKSLEIRIEVLEGANQ